MPRAEAVAAFWSAAELREHELEYSRWAAAALAPTVEVRLSEWAEKNIELPPTDPIPGPLDLSRTPYLPGWFDLSTTPAVTEITAVTSTQVGKSLWLICLLGYCVSHRRVPALLVQAKQPTAKSFNRSRVQPVFRASRNLAPLLPRGRGITEYEVQHANGVRVRYAGAGSPSDLAEASLPVVLYDEFNKYRIRRNAEQADPISEGAERTIWWKQTLVVKTTTPTTEQAYGWRELTRAECQMRFYVPCPHCGAEQILSFSGEKEAVTRGVEKETVAVVDGKETVTRSFERETLTFPGPAGRVGWPRDERGHALHSPQQIRSSLLAWYECGACHAVIEEHQKAEMIGKGRWKTLDGRPPAGHVGLHIWAGYNPRVTWSDIAAKYLDAEFVPGAMQNFVNLTLGKPYRESGAKPSFEVVLARRREGYRMGQVPAGVRFLTFSCDVHAALQYWMVWGWGLGFTGWLVAAGREDTAVDPKAGWERVFQAATREYPVVAFGGEQPVFPTLRVGQFAGVALIDAGWNSKDHDPEENVNEAAVYERCDDWNMRVGGPLFQPAKGGSSRNSPLLNFSGTPYRDARTGERTKGRLNLHVFNPWEFKQDFHDRLSRPGEVGGLWLPSDVPELFLRQFLGEEKTVDPGGEETWHRIGPNHGLDCAVMALAAAFRFGAYLKAPPPERAGPAPDAPQIRVEDRTNRPFRSKY